MNKYLNLSNPSCFMKIGGNTAENMRPSQIAEEFYREGISVVELIYSKEFVYEEIRKIKELNLDISLHCPSDDLKLKYYFWSFIIRKPHFYFKKSLIKKFEKAILTAEKLEATHYIMHGGWFPKGHSKFGWLREKEKFLEALIRDFKPLFIKAKDSGVKFLLENLVPHNIFGETSDIVYVQEKFPWLGFCLDFAHSELTEQTDILKEFDIDHVHISDNDLKNDLHLPIGEGKIDFFKLFSLLKNKDYKGKIICEDTNIYNTVKSIEKTKELLKNFQKLYI